MTQRMEQKLRVAQHSMERSMLGITKQDRKTYVHCKNKCLAAKHKAKHILVALFETHYRLNMFSFYVFSRESV